MTSLPDPLLVAKALPSVTWEDDAPSLIPETAVHRDTDVFCAGKSQDFSFSAGIGTGFSAFGNIRLRLPNGPIRLPAGNVRDVPEGGAGG